MLRQRFFKLGVQSASMSIEPQRCFPGGIAARLTRSRIQSSHEDTGVGSDTCKSWSQGHSGTKNLYETAPEVFIACRPLRASTTIAQSIVHRGVGKWLRRLVADGPVFSTRSGEGFGVQKGGAFSDGAQLQPSFACDQLLHVSRNLPLLHQLSPPNRLLCLVYNGGSLCQLAG